MVTLTVKGDPQPKGSLKCIGGRGGRHRLVEDDKTGNRAPWRRLVATAARQAAGRFGMIPGPVRVAITFRLQQAPSNRDDLPMRKPDIDKLERMILDALVDGGLIEDDARVVYLTARKVWASASQPAGASISVRQATAADLLFVQQLPEQNP